ncbi:iron response transcriptional regulator IrrA [Phreatobacter stygius]|uniref:Ferric uptake regulation protein n=1 Tax=Phreatobacter stygius TaxID=1940610 RepID=A0A4D7B289_9HYPH|nr:Fur family transcriptional regulator [Phreatobacter stygius]QCI63646.1 transcriptional repressor [Phreatobacter stygius]
MLLVPDEFRDQLRAAHDDAWLSAVQVQAALRAAGLRPTRQRIALGRLLFGNRHRHVTAADLHGDALDAGSPLSLATVYNTLNQFADAGLLRRISINGERSYFDTDVGDHHHFYIDAEDRILNIPAGAVALDRLPLPPDGYEITKVDLVVHLTRVAERAARQLSKADPATSAVPPEIDPL